MLPSRKDLRVDFGIEVKVEHRTDPDRADGEVRVHLQDMPGQDVAALEARARDRALDRLTAEHGSDVDAIAKGMQAWESARSRLISDLGDSRDVQINLTTDGPAGVRTTPHAREGFWSWSDDQIDLNPHHYAGLRGTGGGERTRGFTSDYLHERDHHLGCMVGNGNSCKVPDGANIGSDVRQWEDPTVTDVDLVLDAIGVPKRGSYGSGGTGFSRPGGTVTVEGGGTATGPDRRTLLEGP